MIITLSEMKSKILYGYWTYPHKWIPYIWWNIFYTFFYRWRCRL